VGLGVWLFEGLMVWWLEGGRLFLVWVREDLRAVGLIVLIWGCKAFVVDGQVSEGRSCEVLLGCWC
jgi:hypothetical protein